MTTETSNARGEWPERYACNGPEGTFWTDDAALANKLIGAAFDRDEWTVTDTQNPTGAAPSSTAETSNARGEWVLVPREPTEAMIDAWRDAPNRWVEAYAAMLAAAPQPPAEAQPVDGLRVVTLSDAWDYANGRLSWNDLDARAVRHEGAATPLSREHGSLREMYNPSAPVGVDYAKRLATSLWQRHYREDAPQWEPFDDLPGLLSQIDNMVSGLTRAPALAQQPAAVDDALKQEQKT